MFTIYGHVSHLEHIYKCSITFTMEAQSLALIGQDVSEEEIFENKNNVFIQVHGPGQGQATSWSQNMLYKQNCFCQFGDLLDIISYQMTF